MKRLFIPLARFFFIALVVTAPATAQVARLALPQTGFWVVETNPKVERGSMVRFYTNENALIYEEFLEGKCLNVRKAKTQAFLHRALDKAMVNWLMTKQVKTNGEWVAELRKVW